MKHFILTSLLTLALGLGITYANNESGVSQQAIQNFQKEFATATNAQWEMTKEYSRVSFEYQGQVLYAYYSGQGERIALIRNLLVNQLPIRLSNASASYLRDYWITDLFEISSEQESAYYITFENGNEKLVLKSTDSINWQTYEKQVKK